jgi:hypothetical protein
LHNYLSFSKSLAKYETEIEHELSNDITSSSSLIKGKKQSNPSLHKFYESLQLIDTKNGVLFDKIVNKTENTLTNETTLTNNNSVDYFKLTQMKRMNKIEKYLSSKQYEELVLLRHTAFNSLKRSKYQKIKSYLAKMNMNAINSNEIGLNECCYEIVAFILREILTELVELSLNDETTIQQELNSVDEFKQLIDLKIDRLIDTNQNTFSHNTVPGSYKIHTKKYSFFK